jgi:hypothetical protein
LGVINPAIDITSVKISRKYADSGINYLEKSFIILTQGIDVITLFGVIYPAIDITSVKISRNMLIVA